METKDKVKEVKEIVKEVMAEAGKIEKLHTLQIMDVCLRSAGEKEVTIKYEGDDKTHIYIGGKYFQTLPGSQWAKIVSLVVDVTAKAYKQGADDVVRDILENLKETK